MNKYLEKIAEQQKEDKPSLKARIFKPMVTDTASGIVFGMAGRHAANLMHKREHEYNRLVKPKTVSKMIRHNKLDVSLKGNPFGRKRKGAGSSFLGHDNVFVLKEMHGGKRDRVYATDRGAAIHELGHATAYKKSKFPQARYLGRTGSHYAGHLGSYGLLLSGDKEKAKYAPAVAAAPLAYNMWDEGAANVHAYKALKKHQGKLHANKYLRRMIVPQMSNYAAAGAIPIASAVLAKKWIYGKKKDKNNAPKTR